MVAKCRRRSSIWLAASLVFLAVMLFSIVRVFFDAGFDMDDMWVWIAVSFPSAVTAFALSMRYLLRAKACCGCEWQYWCRKSC